MIKKEKEYITEGRTDRMKILIKGAGDLATGIASRLYGAGHQILMTEISTPLTVRRTVALSRAVYESCAEVEGMRGFRAGFSGRSRGNFKPGGYPGDGGPGG